MDYARLRLAARAPGALAGPKEAATREGAAYDGAPAALPLAAAVTLLLAHWLPVGFEYRPNDLGIVSLATLERYPVQQETFWALFAGGVGSLLTWGLARALRRAALPVALVVALEALGAGALLGALWLPPAVASLSTFFCVCCAVALARRGEAANGPLPIPVLDFGRAPARPARALLVVAGAFALGMLLAPGVWAALWYVARDVPDGALTLDHFKFLGEAGQHLAWGNAIWHGGLQGRDVFCLYGPLWDLGLVGFWHLVGRSVAGWELYWSLTRVLGWTALLLLGAALLRRRWLVWVLPFLLPWVKLRVGLPLFALLALLRWLRGGGGAWCALAGALGATALLFSQEFGLAFLLAAAGGLALRAEPRAALAFGAGFALVTAPVLLWFAAEGALAPMLRDLVLYPSYLMAGYGKLPFPPLSPPLDPGALGSGPSLELRLGYAVPAVCVAGLLLALPVAEIDPRRPLASLRALRAGLLRDPLRLALVLVALFGIVSFRSALGRSQLSRTLVVLPAAVLLLGVALDRTLALWRSGAAWRPLAAWRSAALALCVLMGGPLETAAPVGQVMRSVRDVHALVTRGVQPAGSRRVARVVSWVALHTEPGEPVLFLPNDGAYYFLTDRPNPIRFVMGHQIVTDAHRAEVLSDLSAAPPRFIVWDEQALRIDGLSDEQVFGPALLDWIDAHYEEHDRLPGVSILRYRGPAS